MAKNNVASPSPRFVFRKSLLSLEYLRLHYKDELKIDWTLDKFQASYYSSRYSAKTHLSTLRQNHALPEGMMLEQVY